MRHSHFALAGGVFLATLLTACGGSDDDTPPSSLASGVTISAASNATVLGTYTTTSTGLSGVAKESPVGATPFCSFRFDGLAKTDAPSVPLDGRVTYNADENVVSTIKISVGGVTYGAAGGVGTVVDRGTSYITVNNKVMTSEADGASTITATASIPMRGDRPAGC